MTIGKVFINDECYIGQDLYTDGEIEDEMLEIAQNYSEDEFNKIIYDRKSWTILYHFSNVRENIVSWLPISKSDTVLEIGAGCGAITGILAKMAQSVDAVELSMKRTLINAYRHQNLEGITIHVGNFQDVEKKIDKKYDYVTLIGVFEYGVGYIASPNPYVDFLKTIKKHLKKNGKIIIAIENKFGLKYWAGCREEHTENFFEGLEGYQNVAHVRTFGKKELLLIVEEAGLKTVGFYYPYPDYKLPEKIFSDEYLPQINELNLNHRNFGKNRLELFDEGKVYNELIKEGLFQETSNSFLLVLQGE